MKKIGRLHVLTDTVLQSRYSHLEIARMAIRGGADTIQFRQKAGATREMIEIVRQLKQLCTESAVTLLVNDRVDVAIAAEADGVHLGQDDFPILLARKILGKDRIIGGSAATLQEAQKCVDEGTDYIGFGPVYPTSSKEDASPVTGIEVLKKAVEAFPLPIIAIGGISVENAPEVMRAGAQGIAVISAVCCQDNPEKATRVLQHALQAGITGENRG